MAEVTTDVKPASGVSPAPAAVTSAEPAKIAAASPIKMGGKEYASFDEAAKAYESAQSELGRWTQQYGDLKKQNDEIQKRAQQWDEWWKTVQPLWGDDVEALLRQKLTGTKPQAAPKSAGTSSESAATGFEGFELLRPEEQAAKLQQAVSTVMQQQMTQQWQQYAQAMQQALAQKEQWYQSYLSNHLSLLRKALERKLQDPTFDVDKTMEQAAKAMGGQMDPIELGQQLLKAAEFQGMLESAKTASYAQGKKDLEQELANKKLETVPISSAGAPTYKFPAGVEKGSTRHGLGSMRQRAAEDLAKKFGPTIFNE